MARSARRGRQGSGSSAPAWSSRVQPRSRISSSSLSPCGADSTTSASSSSTNGRSSNASSCWSSCPLADACSMSLDQEVGGLRQHQVVAIRLEDVPEDPIEPDHHAGSRARANFSGIHSAIRSGQRAATRIQPSRSPSIIRSDTPSSRSRSRYATTSGGTTRLSPAASWAICCAVGLQALDLVPQRPVDLLDRVRERRLVGLEQLGHLRQRHSGIGERTDLGQLDDGQGAVAPIARVVTLGFGQQPHLVVVAYCPNRDTGVCRQLADRQHGLSVPGPWCTGDAPTGSTAIADQRRTSRSPARRPSRRPHPTSRHAACRSSA